MMIFLYHEFIFVYDIFKITLASLVKLNNLNSS